MESDDITHASKKKKTENGEAITEVADLPEPEEPEENDEAVSVFPLARIKKIMQLATNETIRLDSIKLIAKATELFVEEFAKKGFQYTLVHKKKTLNANDLVEALNVHSNLAFIKEAGIIMSRPRSSVSQTAMEIEENLEENLEESQVVLSEENKDMIIESVENKENTNDN
ncbi:unnamed protein product [Blepharisma stoltei]|uniref:Transcription factor CBF/NF-Y/archaeal histone domain-containing protein n=1 Tax=Blepharisma stoltei TaxID=1481888 RepID=A0AAU9IL32_9CILI|nr:unnamed protein product [Blepharisma stoltei]